MARISSGVLEDAKLSIAEIGPAVSVHLDDEEASASWRIDVDVRINEGRRRLGSIITTPPALAAPKARVVALAMCPGAVEWYVSARLLSGPDDAEADLWLGTSRCCPGLPVAGVAAVAPFAVEAQNEPIFYDSAGATATVGSMVVRATHLTEIMAFRPAVGTTFLQLWAQAAPPAPLDPCVLEPMIVSVPVLGATSGAVERKYTSPLPLRNSSWWTHSSTAAIYTPAVSFLWVRATLLAP